MKLSNKTLSKLIKGACYFEIKDGYLSSYRFSKAQIENLSRNAYDKCWLTYALMSGPQRIEFKTSCTEINFDYKASKSHANNTIDLYIDNVLYRVYHINDTLKGKVEFFLPQGQKLVSIYMPCESTVQIKNFTINGGYKSVKKSEKRVLIIGDSITQGAGPNVASLAYANGLARELGYDILAQGIGGYRYEPNDVMKIDGFEPDKIIVALGTNWYDDSSYDYELNVSEFYKKLTSVFPNIPILAITPIWRGDIDNWDRFIWCINKIKDTCAKYECIKLVYGFTLVPNVEECFSDKAHPNCFGSFMYSSNLIKAIKKLKF
ncbi:MAG: SGNH/GDSL hydrolase family protein [Clostridia bacterium]|nr:SGNH/GDSL hydrolase family protein [Clostridia bacterium]